MTTMPPPPPAPGPPPDGADDQQHPGQPPGGYPGPPGQGYPGQPGQEYPGQAPHPGQQPGSWQQPGPDGDNRTIAILAHLSPVIAMVISVGWLSFLGPLIVWLVWRDRGPLVRNAAASAFNFNITVWIANVAGWICFFTVILIPLAIVLWIGAWVAQVVLSIIGAVRASRGEVYRYPFQVPILR